MLARRLVSITAFALLSCLFVLAHPASAIAAGVTLNWDPSPSTDVAGYKVYRTETAGSFSPTPVNGSSLVTSTSFQDTTTQPGRTYYYAVTAVTRDGLESSRSNVVNVVVTPPNLAPAVNAGADRTITLPTAANLSAVVTDDGLPNGQLTLRWSIVQGSGVSIASPQTATTQVSFTASGVYTLRITASDGQFTSTDDVNVTVNPQPNTAPTVSAGPDQTITLPSSANLTASASDDGRPNGQLTYQWSVVQGSGVSIASPQAASTQVSFPASGVYKLRVIASDGQLTSSDDVNVTVNAAPTITVQPNTAPTVNAGADQSTTLRSANLTATGSDDGRPNGQLTYQWSVVQGSGVSIASPQTASTQLSFSASGAYKLRVTASDGQLTASDDVTVDVTVAAISNRAPTVTAGPDQTTSLRSASLVATASDDGLPTGQLTYQWSVVQGSGVSIASSRTTATQVSFSASGAYTLRVTASDGQLTSSDDVNVTVTGGSNVAPTVSAGPDQTISWRSSANLVATASDDGLPNKQLTYQWSVLKGSGVTLKSPSSAATTASFRTAGTYTLRVIASDGQLTSVDDVVVTVQPKITGKKGDSAVAGQTVTASTTLQSTSADVPSEEDAVTDFLKVAGISSSLQIAIIENANASARVSDAVFKSTPPIRNGQIYAMMQNSQNIGVAIANPNPESVVIDFKFTDETGSMVHAGQLALPPGGMSSTSFNESPLLPTQLPIDLSRIRSFSFSASAPVAAAAVRTLRNERQDLVITAIPIADLDQPTGPVTFPFYADGAGWQSEIQLVNTSNSSLQGVIRQFPGSNPETAYEIAPHTARVFLTSGVGSEARTGWMQIIPAKGTANPAGSLSIINKTNGVTTSMGTILSTPVSALHHVYAETTGGSTTEPGQVQTTLTIVNPASTPASVSLELLDMNGQSTGVRGAVTIAAQDKVSVNLNQIPGMQNMGAFSGIVRIAGDAVTAAGFLTRSNQLGEIVVTAIPAIVPAGPSTSERFLFAADAGGYSTQIKSIEPTSSSGSSGQ